MSDQPITDLLRAWRGGDDKSREQLFRAVYSSLRNIAGNALRGDRLQVELQPTELVNECVIRLIGVKKIEWRDRVHFLGAAGATMRRVLVDQARSRAASKREGVHVTLATRHEAGFDRSLDLLEIDQAMEKLERISPERARAIELKFFAGMTNDEVAEFTGVSVSTARRQIRSAKAWLLDALTHSQ